ncbi:MAG TPA: rhodanese-like domain-containing protein [Edaphobacter sp.]|jgi:rhodanese-related sulfurtransferase|nr:rhodanese-like domain-containing protein [Edaphobacter sp.]
MLYETAVSLVVLVAVGAVGAVAWTLRARHLRKLDSYGIEPEILRGLLQPKASVLLFDVRQPLDVLAYSERIPGAQRISPKDILADPMLIPIDEDVVLYCTCEGQKTSREIIQRGLTLGFSRVRLLRGGLAAWKAKGYPVEPYKESFHLDTAV